MYLNKKAALVDKLLAAGKISLKDLSRLHGAAGTPKGLRNVKALVSKLETPIVGPEKSTANLVSSLRESRFKAPTPTPRQTKLEHHKYTNELRNLDRGGEAAFHEIPDIVYLPPNKAGKITAATLQGQGFGVAPGKINLPHTGDIIGTLHHQSQGTLVPRELAKNPFAQRAALGHEVAEKATFLGKYPRRDIRDFGRTRAHLGAAPYVTEFNIAGKSPESLAGFRQMRGVKGETLVEPTLKQFGWIPGQDLPMSPRRLKKLNEIFGDEAGKLSREQIRASSNQLEQAIGLADLPARQMRRYFLENYKRLLPNIPVDVLRYNLSNMSL